MKSKVVKINGECWGEKERHFGMVPWRGKDVSWENVWKRSMQPWRQPGECSSGGESGIFTRQAATKQLGGTQSLQPNTKDFVKLLSFPLNAMAATHEFWAEKSHNQMQVWKESLQLLSRSRKENQTKWYHLGVLKAQTAAWKWRTAQPQSSGPLKAQVFGDQIWWT